MNGQLLTLTTAARVAACSRYFAVLAGAGLGGLARYIAGVWISARLGWAFPWGTFTINVSGSFLIGLLMAVIAARPDLSPNWRLFLVVGVLGGYTTFSTFEYEVWRSAKDGQMLLSLTYVVSSVVAGYLAVWLGWAIGERR